MHDQDQVVNALTAVTPCQLFVPNRLSVINELRSTKFAVVTKVACRGLQRHTCWNRALHDLSLSAISVEGRTCRKCDDCDEQACFGSR